MMRFRDHEVKDQRSWGSCMQKKACDRIVIRSDGLITIKSIYVSRRANELIRFWDHEVKGHGTHYVCKNSS